MSGSRVSFANETSVISILPIAESVGSDDEDEHWDEEVRMDHPEDDDYRGEEELVQEESLRRKSPAKPPPFQLLRWQEQNKKQEIGRAHV